VEGDGLETVSFPAPGPVPAAGATATVFRATEPADAIEAAPLPSTAPVPAAPTHSTSPSAAAVPHVDELYEHVVERLRRDLLAERERMGDLLGDLP
jgi:hypothetical protein